jgi:hypothetical protein
MFKMTSKTTVVTMYFNIKNLPDATDQVRPQSFYMEKGRATLGLDFPMIVFCDDTCYDDIKTLRGDRPTHYIVKSLLDYDFYKDNYDIIKNNRVGNPHYVDSRNTTSYCILTIFKLYAMHLAKQSSPFIEATHYAWVDFGGSHILRNFEEYAPLMLRAPHPKVAFCYIHFRGAQEMTMTSEFAKGGYCGVGATCFTIERDYVSRFYNACISIFHEMLAIKLCHHEEQIMAYFYHRYPELCTLYYGDYYSILSNYHVVRDDYESVKRYFIMESLVKGRRDLASGAAKAVLSSVENGNISLHQNEIEFLKSLG